MAEKSTGGGQDMPPSLRRPRAIDVFKKMTERLDIPELQKGLPEVARDFMNMVIAVDQRRPEPHEPREYAMMLYKLAQFIFSREQRHLDIQSSLVQDAIRIKESLLPYGTPKLSICIDVRVNPKLHGGLHGNAFRTSAGDNAHEFVQLENSDELVLRDGEFTHMIRRAFKETDDLFEEFDSHLGCAARKKKVAGTGKNAKDGGLKDDIIRKRKMIDALKQHVHETYRGRKRVHCIQTSFDTHTGYLYTGLERCLPNEHASEEYTELEREIARDGFTQRVLDQLVADGRIISTRHMVENPDDDTLRAIFANHYFFIDYPQDYQSSTFNFWNAVQHMGGQALPLFKRKLISIFPLLATPDHEKELNERAWLLLANTFSGYLHNTNADGIPKQYPFSEHDESVIVVSYSEKGPYDRARAFNVDPQTPDLLEDIGLAQDLIRDNREAGRMSPLEREARDTVYHAGDEHPEGKENGLEYKKCPILVFTFARLKRIPDPHILSVIRCIDWSDLGTINWMDMSNKEFLNYLDEKFSNIPSYIANGIDELRRRAIKLHDNEGDSTTELFVNGNLAPVCVLAGPDRETLTIIPFLTNGYKRRRKQSLRTR